MHTELNAYFVLRTEVECIPANCILHSPGDNLIGRNGVIDSTSLASVIVRRSVRTNAICGLLPDLNHPFEVRAHHHVDLPMEGRSHPLGSELGAPKALLSGSQPK